MKRDTIDRAWAATLAVMTIWLITTTNLSIDLWFISGPAALWYGFTYAGIFAAIAVDPTSIRLHRVALPMGWLFWGGRAATAVPVALERDGPVWTVVSTAISIGALVTALHLLAVRAHAAQTAVPGSGDG